MLDPAGPALNSPTVDVTRPWLGLLPFSESTRAFFFGRDAEIAEIQDRIEENILTTLFGQSGLGKTSLLGAGVLPRLRENGKSPVLLRLDHDPTAPSLLDQTHAALRLALPGIEWPSDAGSVSLWELVHRQPELIPAGTPAPILLFDQFEEIFTLGQQHPAREGGVAAWLEQIADLIQCRPPKALEERFAENRRLARDYDFGRCPVRFVFSLREDYLSHLEGWKATLPLLVQNRMSLHLLDGPQALEAVIGPASLGDPPLVSREVAMSIVRTVARVPADTPLPRIRAVPPLLSLLCEQLNSARLTAGAERIDASMVSERSEDILHHFYEESFAPFPDNHREKIRAVIEDRMVTVGGHRHPVAREDAEAELAGQDIPRPAEVFDALIHRRLLTAEEHGGLQRLEITHDVLLPLVVRSRKERRERQEREAFQRHLAEEATQARKRRVVVSAMALLTLLATTGAIFAWMSNRKVNHLVEEKELLEGLGWLQRALAAGNESKRYPDALMFAAKAIGFEGAGRPSGDEVEHPRLIREKTVGDESASDAYRQATLWLQSQPAYIPVWADSLRSGVTALDFSPDGKLLAAGSEKAEVKLWDFSSGSSIAVPQPDHGPVHDLAFKPTGDLLALASGDVVAFWKLEGGAFTPSRSGMATSITYTPDGGILAEGDSSGRMTFRHSGHAASIVTGLQGGPARLDSSADRSVMAAAFPGNGIRVFFPKVNAMAFHWPPDAAFITDPSRIPPSNVTSVAVNPDGRTVALGTDDGRIGVWDVLRVAMIRQIPPDQRHKGTIRDLRFRSDGLQLASAADDGLVKLWTNTGDDLLLAAALAGHEGAVNRIRYAPGGELLASGGADGQLKLWDVSGKPRSAMDLYSYLDRKWYQIDDESRLLVGKDARGVLNLPPGSVAAAWASAPRTIAGVFMNNREWTGAIAALPSVEEAERESLLANMAVALTSDAMRSAEVLDWNHAELQLARLESFGRSQAPELEKLRTARSQRASEGTDFLNGNKMNMVWCAPGEFTMGSPEKEPGHAKRGEVQHRVTLTRGFWIGRHEVTQAQWTSMMETNPSVSTKSGSDAPVENIDWHQAIEFCRRLTDHERLLGIIPAGWEYSLPTQAQWQYACRANTETAYCFGPDRNELHRYGNYRDAAFGESTGLAKPEKKVTAEDYQTDWDNNDKHVLTAPVGSYLANPWGLFDMHGNVSEWCLDHFEMAKPNHFQPGDLNPPDPFLGAAPERLDRKVCGGSWNDNRNDNRSAKSVALRSTTKKWTIGMRVVLVPIREPG